MERRAQRLFEAAVSAVQARLEHLSKDEIRRGAMADARLARQTALHLTIRHFGLTRAEALRGLDVSADRLRQALRAVDARLLSPRFSDVYFAMAMKAGKLASGRYQHG
jgi:2'-5' RNA ligase